mmetsp:Transcript_30560/g.92437  ORF Transcript_30560/g.92437 Transcript_30560/m.92437 type:complete len:388 (-) Transcript_30560:11-1174(-)
MRSGKLAGPATAAGRHTAADDAADGLAPSHEEMMGRAKACIAECDFSNDLLETWACRETELLRSPDVGEDPPRRELPAEVRVAATWVLARVADELRVPAYLFYKAATIFDTFHRKDRFGGDFTEILPSILVAIFNILFKVHLSGAAAEGARATAARRVSAWLEGLLRAEGYGFGVAARETPQSIAPHLVQSAQEQQLREHPPLEQSQSPPPGPPEPTMLEQRVLRALSWQIDPPTAHGWLEAFCVRFDAATQGLFKASVTWTWKESVPFARVMMQHCAVFRQPPPRAFATGLFCYGLSAAQLLSGDSLRPTDGRVGELEWQRLFSRLGQVDECLMPEQCQASLLECVAEAALTTPEGLRSAAWQFLSSVQDPDILAHAMQYAQRATP